MNRPNVLRWGGVLINLVLLAEIVLACTPGASPGTDRTRRVSPEVWAGAPATDPPRLTDNSWKALNPGDAIRTDNNGQAQLELVKCSGSLYVFKQSAIQVATCLKGDQASGLATCAQQGTGWFNIDCTSRFVVDTLAGRVTISGTAFSVTYVPERRLMLVIVFRGTVAVQPVLDFDTGELAQEAIPVEAGRFFYTMPGPLSPELRGVPARQSLPLQQLPPLVEELGVRAWMDDTQLKAEQDGVLMADWPFAGGQAVITVALLGRGGALEDVRVQNAVLAAVDKDAVLAAAYPGREVVLIGTVGGEEVDGRGVGYDPASATSLLAEAGRPEGFAVQLVFPAEDPELAGAARGMADYLAKVGIDVKLAATPGAELQAAVEASIRAEEPVLWLERR